ncbi:polysaccharide biosynthesis tyrosine autokinase [Desulfuromonas sp. CSMB_57]|uniref:GumC family protein n=1 Tax=Desulfuromonas sp. CSMB_57 TaxID=2807629 RepID=UPI0024BDC523|nr:polysaccharide biosynthesis tyrosine autokinase [Desulfuromonas sp. CSMB_57]
MALNRSEIHLRDIGNTLRKYQRVAAIFFLSVFGLVLVGTFAATPYYEGAARVMIEKVEGESLGGSSSGRGIDPEFYQTQYQLIRSRAVVGRVINLLDLERNYDAYHEAALKRQSWLQASWRLLKNGVGSLRQKTIGLAESGGDPPPADDNKRREFIIEEIRSHMTVRPVEGTRLVDIVYLSPNPQLASLVANTTARAYIEETLELKMEATRRNLEWMSKKAESEAEKLKKSEQALQAYMRANNIVTLEDRLTVTPETLSEINLQLLRAETRRKELEILSAKVGRAGSNYQNVEAVAAVSADPALQAIRAQIVETEKNIMELSNKYGSRHPLMVKAQGDLSVLERKKRQEIDRITRSIRNEYELALSNERTLRGKLSSTKSEAFNLNEKFIQYGALKRVVDTNRQLYDALMLRLKEQSITEEKQPVSLWLVEQAVPPKVPAKPWKKANLLIGMVVGLFGAVGLAFLLDYLDNTIKEPEQAEAALGLPILGVVSRRHKHQHGPEEAVLRDPLSPFAESYRGLRTAIFLSFADRPPKRILFTSSGAGEGKSTTAVNLAMVLAQSEKRVLLVDGDLRKPRLHQIFKVNNSKGLSTYLAGATDGHILCHTNIPNLSVIPAGPIPPNPSELLISSRLGMLLDSVGQEFDVIICDSPPVLPVSDARLLSSLFDGVILVALAGKTSYDIAQRSIKMLRDINARLLGVVINSLEIEKTSYYHHSYYHYYEGDKKNKKATGQPEAT